jgi:hydroxymethylpyrimidine kinase/phosphomethylpyrimidine kinase
MRKKRVMTIGGSDSSGGAGIQADLKTFSALGVYGTSVLTAITAQNSYSVHAIQEVSPNIVAMQIQSIMSDKGIAVDYAKTGMLYSSETIEVVASQLKNYNIPFVLDPVMKAGSGGSLLEDDAFERLTKLLMPLCAVITPNVPEAGHISGLEIRRKEDVEGAAVTIHKMGAPVVIIKGGHLEQEVASGKATDVLYDGKFKELSVNSVAPGKRVHGAGCSFSAALAAELAKGKPVYEAASAAKRFVYHAIVDGEDLSNVIVVDPIQRVRKDADRHFVLENVKEAVKILQNTPQFKDVIPEVGTNIGMAIEGAENEHDVAAVDGRIIPTKEGMHAGCVDFGVSSHVARMILTMMQQDKKKRSAINVKYSSEIIDACKGVGLRVSSFEREKEPVGLRTMDWGVREASIEISPDVIFDRGAVGKEPMIRIFGNTAVEVAIRIRMILGGYRRL